MRPLRNYDLMVQEIKNSQAPTPAPAPARLLGHQERRWRAVPVLQAGGTAEAAVQKKYLKQMSQFLTLN